MLRFLLTSILLSTLDYANARDHLEPEDSPFSEVHFSEYVDLVLEYLDTAYDENVKVRLIAMPSFSPEYAVGIRRLGEKYWIFYEAPTVQLWEYQTLMGMDELTTVTVNTQGDYVKDTELEEKKKKLPQNPMNIPSTQCDREIPRVLAKEIQYIWHEMLYDTRFHREFMWGRDGVIYHFSASVDGRTLAGQIWSPEENSRTGRLVDVSNLMVDYCLDNKKNASKLIQKVRALRSDINRALKPQSPPDQITTKPIH